HSERKTVEVIPLTADTFKRDALIYKGYEKAEMQVRSSKSEHGVSVAFAGFPYVGVWSMPNCAPYVCIEPWMGHSHVEGFTGDFEEKVGMIALQNGGKWQGTYTITIF
ncbi:MAG: aldose 1-epimerase family protein, partial [Bacilli bacterium]